MHLCIAAAADICYDIFKQTDREAGIMNRHLNRLYEKSELWFALFWIILYCVSNSVTNLLSDAIGINSAVTFVWNVLLTLLLLRWLKENRLLETYGLCRSHVPAARFLWYVPLAVIVSRNLWLGVAVNLPALDTVCYLGSMLCVGFLEEVVFRGFLFKAIAKDDVKTAIIISSVTFGVGHIMNLFNGSGMDLLANLCQIVGAIVMGFLFVVVFYRGGSLWPCIIAHSVNNMISAFANESAWTAEKEMLFAAIHAVIVAVYTLILLKTLPKPTSNR